jgi:hypothetical protein
MDMPTLDSLRGPMLDDPVFETLGTQIIYTPAGGVPISIKALINSEDMERSYDQSNAIVLDPQFKIRKSSLPAKPLGTDRFTCDRYPGKVFKPANVMNSRSGTRWKFDGKIT